VGGSATSIEQVPYQVSVRLTANDRKSYGSGHLCGGVVISQRLVATAAHCCYMWVRALLCLKHILIVFNFLGVIKKNIELLVSSS